MLDSLVSSRRFEDRLSSPGQLRAVPPPIESNRSPTQADFKVGHRIKSLRRQQGLTQKEVAGRVGVTGAQLHRYEVGTTRVATSRLVAIATALGVRPERLIAEPASLTLPAAEPSSSGDLVELMELFSSMADKRRRSAVVVFARSLVAEAQSVETDG